MNWATGKERDTRDLIGNADHIRLCVGLSCIRQCQSIKRAVDYSKDKFETGTVAAGSDGLQRQRSTPNLSRVLAVANHDQHANHRTVYMYYHIILCFSGLTEIIINILLAYSLT